MRQMTTTRPRHPAPRPPEPSPPRQSRDSPAAVVAVRRLFAAETGNYFLLLGTTLFLVAFGLVMVLSSSSVTSYTQSDNFFRGFERQATFAALGLPLMLLASRMPTVFWKKWAPLAIMVGLG